jgi:hypothetical protein
MKHKTNLPARPLSAGSSPRTSQLCRRQLRQLVPASGLCTKQRRQLVPNLSVVQLLTGEVAFSPAAHLTLATTRLLGSSVLARRRRGSSVSSRRQRCLLTSMMMPDLNFSPPQEDEPMKYLKITVKYTILHSEHV